MRKEFEEFANMTLIQWASLMTIAASAVVVRLLVEKQTFVFSDFVRGSIMSAFVAYLTALYCQANEYTGKIVSVIVGCVTYQAGNILTGLGKLGAAFAADPIGFYKKVKKDMKR